MSNQLTLYSRTPCTEEKEDLAGKPEEIKEKIVMGRMKKKYEDGAAVASQAARQQGIL